MSGFHPNKNNGGGGCGRGGGEQGGRQPAPTGQLKRGGTVGTDAGTPHPSSSVGGGAAGIMSATSLVSGVLTRSNHYRRTSADEPDLHGPMEPPLEEEWHYLLPDSWSCQENNAAGIVGDEFGLRLISPGCDTGTGPGGGKRALSKQASTSSASAAVSSTLTRQLSAQPVQRVALVVANKPIPMAGLIQQSEKRRVASSLPEEPGPLSSSPSQPSRSPPKRQMDPRMPSYNPSNNNDGSIFPTFTKPSRHERVDSDPDKLANANVPDMSGLVGMMAGTNHAKNNRLYDDIVPRFGAPAAAAASASAAAATGSQQRAVSASAASAPTTTGGGGGEGLPADVYYFEVRIVSGISWVGLVPAESVVTPEQAQMIGGTSSAATKPNPFPILIDQIPGKSPGSIGLGCNGRLLVSGSTVRRDGKHMHTYGAGAKDADPWTEPFAELVGGEEGTDTGGAGGHGPVTVGCGWEIGGRRRVFFTLNGQILHPDRPITGFDARGDTVFPAVGMQTEGTDIMANFGLDAMSPFCWRGGDGFRAITDKADGQNWLATSAIGEGAAVPLAEGSLEDGINKASPSSVRTAVLPTGGFTNTSMRSIRNDAEGSSRRLGQKADPFRKGSSPTDNVNATEGCKDPAMDRKKREEEDFERAIKESMVVTTVQRHSTETLLLLTREEVEDAKGFARDLRSISQERNADPKLLRQLLEMCKEKHAQVVSNLEQEPMPANFDILIDLGELLRHSIGAAEDALKARKTEPSPRRTDPQPGRHDNSRRPHKETIKISSSEVDALVQSKDIFSLICLLRGQHDNRFASAYALMRFARDEAKVEPVSTDVRKEILASGGMHSLLTLFKSRKDGPEVKIVAALAVAYLLPCVTDPASFSTGNLGIKVIECLRYLVDMSKNKEKSRGISPTQMRESAALALTNLWLNSLQPILTTKDDAAEEGTTSKRALQRSRTRRRGSLGRPLAVRNVGGRGRRLDQRQDTLEIQELLESTVSLIVRVAGKIYPHSNTEQDHDEDELSDESSYNALLPAVQSMCSVELARPVAVREGLLKVLVQWLDSGDPELVRPAATALRDLTALNDAYMAGWIHSEIVNENAMPAIVKLSVANQADVRLAVAEILSSLSVAPHTRAAIIDNSGLNYLVQLLVNITDGTEDEIQRRTALAVGNALLQLAAGAMTNTHKALGYGSSSSERMDVINGIVQGGAIEPLVTMAKSNDQGELRLMSVDFLCIISEDVRAGVGTREKLCHAGAARAFGMVLRQDVPILYRAVKRSKSRLQDEIGAKLGDTLDELYGALLALANLLEPISANEASQPFQSTLIAALMQTAESGGLESLLLLTSLPIASNASHGISDSTVDMTELRIESCRSLASLCPLLLSKSASESGMTRWAGEVLLALTNVLRCKVDADDNAEAEIIRELQLDALRGLCSLAEYEPLKIRIIDGSLSKLLQLKNVRGKAPELLPLAKAANQVCLALGFRDDEIDLQLIGNDPKLSADWFCLERTMLLQAMARDEIRQCLCDIWCGALRQAARQVGAVSESEPLAAFSTRSRGGMAMIQEVSERLLTSGSSILDDIENDAVESGNAENDKDDLTLLKELLFKQLGEDSSSAELRNKMLFQYETIYKANEVPESKIDTEVQADRRSDGEISSSHSSSLPFDDTDFSYISSPLSKESSEGPTRRNSLTAELRRLSRASKASADSSDTQTQEGAALLGISPCTMIGSMTEREWILSHGRALHSSDKGSSLSSSMSPLPRRVQMLLNIYFPSKLLQSEVLPLHDFCPDSSFDFRALAMPERRYFSFRREGQVLSRVCEKHLPSSDLDSEEVYWTLGFTNSTFAGEFAETLVQALYRCPIIQAITFSKKNIRPSEKSSSDDEEDDGSTLLANLAVSLPPWVTYLTFDNVLSNRALTSLVKTMGQLSAESQNVASSGSVASSLSGQDLHRQGSQVGNAQGSAFRGFAIRNSSHLPSESFAPFFDFLGYQNGGEVAPFHRPPLLSLRCLDLAGNGLGDASIASILSIVHDENSQCSLERLDVTGNDIGEGIRVTQVLRSYTQRHRLMQLHGRRPSDAWCSPLIWLGLASNNLCDGQLALELFAMLKDDALALRSLDLSDNGLPTTCVEGDTLPILCSSLKSNTRLVELDLSRNCFSHDFVKGLIEDARSSAKAITGLAFLGLDQNDPPLEDQHISDINKILSGAKLERVKRHLEAKSEPQDNKKDSSLDADELDLQDIEPPQRPYASESSIADKFSNSIGREINNEANAGAVVKRPKPIRAQSENSIARHRHGQLHPDNGTQSPLQEKRASLARNNKITVLFSAPLVYKDNNDRLLPIDSLDFELERELLWQCYKEASRDIELSFDNATTDRLQATMTKGCGCLHFSGHGHPSHLTFEDGKGGMHWLAVETLKNLISIDVHGGAAPFQFVFVSACHSLLAGTTFVNAGVPHVVCCQQESQLMDSAALAFTRAFYLALAIGRTVKDSFEIGRQAVAVSPSVPDPSMEMKKFVLLPEDGNHDFPVFNAEPVTEWPKKPEGAPTSATTAVSRRSLLRTHKNVLGSSRHFDMGSQMMSEQHLPTPPQGFLGREVELYKVLNAVLDKRLVNLVGATGIGRSSLAAALCHYINDRKSTMIAVESIFYVRARQTRGGQRFGSVLFPLQKQLVAAGKAMRLPEETDVDAICRSIYTALLREKTLIVFDRLELLEGTEEAQEFPLFLNTLFLQTKHVKVLMTALKPLGLSSLGGVGEHVMELGPLNLKNTVKLFGILCPHVHTAGERTSLLNALVEADDEDLCASDDGLSERSRDVMKMLGEGIPARVFDVAYQMSKEEYLDVAASTLNE